MLKITVIACFSVKEQKIYLKNIVYYTTFYIKLQDDLDNARSNYNKENEKKQIILNQNKTKFEKFEEIEKHYLQECPKIVNNINPKIIKEVPKSEIINTDSPSPE